MITLYLARHGQTEENLARILQGHMPGRLTEEGKKQAALLGEQLKQIELDAVVSSDLQRCKDTVSIALGGRDLPWEQTPLLREINWGSLTGTLIKEVDFDAMPADVESREMLYERAGKALDYLRKHYDGMRILVVGHGLINRAMEAHIQDVSLQQIRSVPKMNNAELRQFTLFL